MANLSSSTFARVVVALDVFDNSTMTSSRKDNKFFACLCFTVESTEVLCKFEASRLFLGNTVAVGTLISASEAASFSH